MSKKQKPTGNTGRKNQIKGKYAKNILKLQTGNIDPLLDYLRDDSLIEKVNEGEIILKPETNIWRLPR